MGRLKARKTITMSPDMVREVMMWSNREYRTFTSFVEIAVREKVDRLKKENASKV